jgi:hypothetical protein
VRDSDILRLVKVACNIADIIGFPAVKCQQQASYLEATSPLPLRPGRGGAPPEEDLRANVTARLAAFEGRSRAVTAPPRGGVQVATDKAR